MTDETQNDAQKINSSESNSNELIESGISFTNDKALEFFAKSDAIILNDVRRALSTLDSNFRPKRFEQSQIRSFMEQPQKYERQLREVSQYFMVISPHYRRVVGYFSSMLTFDHFVMPASISADKISKNDTFRRNYERSTKYMDNFRVKHEFSKIMKILMTEGVFFGYERPSNNSAMLQRLPTNYCRITGQEDGVWTFAFNFNYFNNSVMSGITPYIVGNVKGNVDALANYPKEFTDLYNQAKDSNIWWQELNSDSGAVCFKFDEDVLHSVPPLSGTFQDIMDLEDYKDMVKSKLQLDNYKLLIQTIPMKKEAKSEKDFVISLPSVQKFHDNLKSSVPSQVGVITTPMPVTEFDFEKVRTKEDIIGQAERNYFTSAGVTSALFNAAQAGSIGIERSINVDEAYVTQFLRQVETFFRKRLNKINTNPTYAMKAEFPDLTVYNRDAKFDSYLKAAQYGFPKSYVAAALGVSVSDLMSLISFENDFLGLGDVMTPLVSSHTGGGTASTADNGGRPSNATDSVNTDKNTSRAKK